MSSSKPSTGTRSREPGPASPTDGEPPLGFAALGLLAVAAAIPRLSNLGNASLWLDEVIQTENASAPLAEVLANVERWDSNPPLDTLVTWIQLQLGAPEALRRCVPALFGVLTVVILARWASERFGRLTGWSVGVVAGLSPLHVHYSQELRPYSLALLFMACALWSFDYLLRTESPRAWVLLGLSLLGCAYTLYFSVVVVVVLLVLAGEAVFSAEPERRGTGRRVAKRLPVLAAVLTVAYLPWLRVALGMTDQPIIKQAEGWSWSDFLRRFEHLTVGGLEGDPSTAWLWPALGLLALGAMTVARRPAGWAIVAGAVAGTAGIQGLLMLENHWTNDRYYLVGWPFCVLLIGLGIAWIGARRRFRPAPRLLMIGLLALLFLVQAPRIERYYERGRPDWSWISRAIDRMTGPDDRIVAANDWTKRLLSHYLPRVSEGQETYPILVTADVEAASERSSEGCGFLVAGGWPGPGSVVRRLAPRARLLSDPGGLGTHLYGLTPYSDARDCVWVPPRDLRSRPRSRFLSGRRDRAPAYLVLDFTAATTGTNLLSGWSRFEANASGDTYVWATGDRAILALGGLEPRTRTLAIELWTLSHALGPQRLGVRLNGELLAETDLAPGAAAWTTEVPARLWSGRENLLAFAFAHTQVPAELDPGSSDDRALAASFHRLELKPW